MKKPLLSLQSVWFGYEHAQYVLKNISADIYAGEKIAVLGNNGAGKSTFFLICNGILKPEQGAVLFDGKPVTYSKSDLRMLRKHVGIVFQEADNQLIAPTVLGEVSFGPLNLGLSRDEVRARTEAALCELELSVLQSRPPHRLSGGEKKRVCIADILAMAPTIMLLDEPTASLDPANTALLEKTLHTLSQKGITLLLSTHDIDFAHRFADRILIFCGGELVADGTPDQIFADEHLLTQAGLRQPSFYRAAALLRQYFPNHFPPIPSPRTEEEFSQFLKLIVKGDSHEL